MKILIPILLVASLVFIAPIFSQASNALKFAAVGDVECKSAGKKVGDAMKATDAKVHVLLGDVGYGNEKCAADYFREKGVPLLIACGNHDDCEEIIKVDNIKTGDKTTYGFKWENVGFLILNTETSISKQRAEGERLMTKFQNDPTIDSIVIAQHKPAVTNPSAHHHESEAKGYRQVFDIWHQQYPKFDLLLFGHNHGYQVCEPTTPKVLVITDGTGGRKPYSWGSQMDDNCHDNLSGSKYNGFTMIDIGANGIQYRHVNVNQ